MHLAIYTHPDCAGHDMGGGHPECPARLAAVNDALTSLGLMDWARWLEAPLVEREALLRVHPAAYVDRLFAQTPDQGARMIDGDTLMMPGTLPAARRAAGAAIAATDAVLEGRFEAAFCSVRPPGHHAERERSMGFCFFGNVAAAARHALDVHGLERVAICDFDVHHGNGTEHLVADDPRILFCSTFQFPLFPGYYGEDVPGQRVNCPLDPGTEGQAMRTAVEQRWLPALEAFAPELVLVSAGFDAHRADPVGGLKWDESDYHWVSERIGDVADRSARGRIVSVLEGGYDLPALGRSAAAHVRALLRQPEPH